MKIYNYFFLIIITLFSQSCAVIQNVERGNLTVLNQDNIHQLDGIYSDSSHDNILEPWGLERSLWNHIKNHNGTYREGKQTVELKVINSRKIQAQLFSDGKLIKKKMIRGKFKDGYFYRNPYFFIYPFIPLLFGFDTHRYRIGIVENTVVLDCKHNYFGFFLFAGGSKNYQVELICPRN